MNVSQPSRAQNGGPPKNLEAGELWTKLTEMPRPHKLIAFPRRNATSGQWFEDKLAIMVLTEGELMQARVAAHEYTVEMLGKEAQSSPAYGEVYKNELVVELVVRCCRSPSDLKVPPFPSAKLVRQYLTSDELAVLCQAYCDWQVEAGPIVSSMTKGEMDQWIRTLQEGAERFPLAQLSSAAVKDLLMHMASQLSMSPTDNGSAGSPPETSSSATAREMSQSYASRSSSSDDKPPPPERDA